MCVQAFGQVHSNSPDPDNDHKGARKMHRCCVAQEDPNLMFGLCRLEQRLRNIAHSSTDTNFVSDLGSMLKKFNRNAGGLNL